MVTSISRVFSKHTSMSLLCWYPLRDSVIRIKEFPFIWMLMASLYLTKCSWHAFQNGRYLCFLAPSLVPGTPPLVLDDPVYQFVFTWLGPQFAFTAPWLIRIGNKKVKGCIYCYYFYFCCLIVDRSKTKGNLNKK